MTEQNDLKKGLEKKEEDITSYADGKDLYHVGDTVYIESQRPDMPFFVCSIRDFKRSKKDNITVDVVWYYRPCEIPTSVYQLLLQDRNAEFGSSDHVLDNPVVKSRELFISDAIDVYPAHALRGHANCVAFSEIKENIMSYIAGEDNWFYILRYNPESRRMANAKGEIRIGVSHQACLPPYIPYHQRSKADLKELNESCLEDLLWDPSIQNSKLMVYLRAARSITSYNEYCESQDVCPEKLPNNGVSEDQTIAHSYDTLHSNKYNISEALQELIRNPTPHVKSQPMTDDEKKKFMRGLRSYGKTFHKIRKELLPDRNTAELVHYYYIWKKTPAAISSRPHKRGGRRTNVLARKTRTTKPKTAEISEFLDLSSCDENEFEDSEDSENPKNYSLYACRHCYTTESPNWHHAGKPKVLLCCPCRLHFKRYGYMKPLKEEEKREPPPFIYKATFENLDEDISSTGRMRTRRSSTPVFANTSRKVLEGKFLSRKPQVTAPTCREPVSDKEDGKGNGTKRKSARDIEQKKDAKKLRGESEKESDAEDADDESEGDSEPYSRTDSNNEKSTDNSRTQSPENITNHSKEKPDDQLEQQGSTDAFKEPVEFVPIKQEADEEIPDNQFTSSPPSSPDVPDELTQKIAVHFKHYETEPGNSCSRCEMVFVYKRPKKQRPVEIMEVKRREEQIREKEFERRHVVGSPPLTHQNAQITSHYETLRMIEHRQRYFHNFQHLPPEVHGQRATSPRGEYIMELNKFSHLMPFNRQPDHPRGPHTPHSITPKGAHPAHPFTQKPSESPRDFRISSAPRSHGSGHMPPIDTLSRTHGLSDVDRVPGIERPLIDPATGLPHIQPHLHSHLHTHTHLHVHPEKYRSNQLPPEAHFDRHERATPHPVRQPSPSPIQHRPNSRNREYHEALLKQYPELVAHVHDPHMRDPLSRHVAIRDGHLAAPSVMARDGAGSPTIPHEMRDDPVAYHHWLTRMHHRLGSHGNQSHPQAPELSPHGMPLHQRHPHELRSEHEKHIDEKLMQAHAEREKLVRSEHHLSRDQFRSLEHDRYLRYLLQSREVQHDTLKMKGEHHLPERHLPFRHEIHPPYSSHNHFMESLRRGHETRVPIHDRSIHESLRYGPDRVDRERIPPHFINAERYPDRARHERPSIFGSYKPETINLCDD